MKFEEGQQSKSKVERDGLIGNVDERLDDKWAVRKPINHLVNEMDGVVLICA